MAKYEFTDETMTCFEGDCMPVVLTRIRATQNFADVFSGELGGFIERASNLSQDGSCWVYPNGAVFANAQVVGGATVRGHARVFGCAVISGEGEVGENAKVYGNATIRGNAVVHGYAQVFEQAIVEGDADVYGSYCVFGTRRLTTGSYSRLGGGCQCD